MKKPKDEMRTGYKRLDFTSLERGKFHKEAVKGTAVKFRYMITYNGNPLSMEVTSTLDGNAMPGYEYRVPQYLTRGDLERLAEAHDLLVNLRPAVIAGRARLPLVASCCG